MKISAYLFSVLLFLAGVPGAHAQVTRDSNQQDWLVYYGELANDFIARASSNDPDLAQDYIFRVTEGTAIPSAMAIYRGSSGGPEIHINQSFILMSLFLADIYHVNATSNNIYLGCAEQYVNYLQREVERSIAKEVRGARANELLPPEDVAFSSPACSGIENALPLPEDQRPRRDQLVINAIGFMILHEIGHLRLHSHNVPSNDFSNLNKALSHFCSSRSTELQADRFAVRKMFEQGWSNGLHYTPLWHVISVSDPVAAAAANERWIFEGTATHPLAVDRMGAAYSYMLSLHDAHNLSINSEMKNLVDQLTDLIEKKDFLSELNLRDIGILSLDLGSCG